MKSRSSAVSFPGKAGRLIKGSRILVLGYAYLENSDDTRNSPSEVLVKRLRELGAEPEIHDPYITDYQGDVIEKAMGCDAVVVMVAHTLYTTMTLSDIKNVVRTPLLVDGRHVFDPVRAKEQGWIYRGVGVHI